MTKPSKKRPSKKRPSKKRPSKKRPARAKSSLIDWSEVSAAARRPTVELPFAPTERLLHHCSLATAGGLEGLVRTAFLRALALTTTLPPALSALATDLDEDAKASIFNGNYPTWCDAHRTRNRELLGDEMIDALPMLRHTTGRTSALLGLAGLVRLEGEGSVGGGDPGKGFAGRLPGRPHLPASATVGERFAVIVRHRAHTLRERLDAHEGTPTPALSIVHAALDRTGTASEFARDLRSALEKTAKPFSEAEQRVVDLLFERTQAGGYAKAHEIKAAFGVEDGISTSGSAIKAQLKKKGLDIENVRGEGYRLR